MSLQSPLSRIRPWFAFSLSILTIAAVGCTSDDDDGVTKVVVVVDTTLSIPTMLDAIRTEVVNDTGVEGGVDTALSGPQAHALPIAFEVTPAGGDPDRERAIRVHGYLQGTEVITRTARFSFVRGKSKRLDVMLAPACVRVVCGPSSTCIGEGVCIDDHVDVSKLPDFVAGSLPDGQVPAPTQDAGVDSHDVDAPTDEPDALAAIDAPVPQMVIDSAPPTDVAVDAPSDAGVDALPPPVVPPQILELSPTSDAAGVLSGARIKMRFSQSMDRATVEQAWSVRSGADLAGSFEWNDDSTSLAWSADDGFPHDADVRVHVDASARDRDGTALERALDFVFHTARHGTLRIKAGEPYGYVRPVDHFVGLQSVVVGDSVSAPVKPPQESPERSFLSFDLADVPVDAVVTSATFNIKQNACVSAWQELGALLIEHVDFGAVLDPTDFDLVPNRPAASLTPPGPVAGWRTASIASFVQDDYDHRSERENRAQVRLRFEKETSGDGASDLCAFSPPIKAGEEPFLNLEYEYR